MSPAIPEFSLALIAVLSPPAYLDYRPELQYTLKRPTFEQTQLICAPAGIPKGYTVLGCTNVNTRVVYIPIELEGEFFDLILHHEWAHLNGGEWHE